MNIYPQLMIIGGIVGGLGLILALSNMVSATKNFQSTSMVGIFIRHIIFGLMYVGGGAAFVIGLILYIIKVCKS